MSKKGLVIITIAAMIIVAGSIVYRYQKEHNDTIITPISIPINSASFSNVVDANNQFAIDLYSQYKSRENNVFFSPYSILSALTMTYEGAKGQTASEIQKVLHLPSDKDKMRSDFIKINDELNKSDKPYKLITANALWLQKDYPFLSNYLDVIKKYYDGIATNLNFKINVEQAILTINKWVETQTNGKIKNIISSLDKATKLVLTNAIYFKANWVNPFDINSTKNDDFHLNSESTIKVKMMHQIDHFAYGENKDIQLIELPYEGEDISMIVLLSRTNSLDNLEKIFSVKLLNSYRQLLKMQKVELSLPKFTFETKSTMADTLSKMGMPTAFQSLKADFSGMSELGDLFIDQVIHQTFINVDEKGTEAAAATAIVMAAGAAPSKVTEPIKIFNADHPFIFIIQQKQSGNILFIGTVNDPLR
jgi:serpin B